MEVDQNSEMFHSSEAKVYGLQPYGGGVGGVWVGSCKGGVGCQDSGWVWLLPWGRSRAQHFRPVGGAGPRGFSPTAPFPASAPRGVLGLRAPHGSTSGFSWGGGVPRLRALATEVALGLELALPS